MTGQQIKCDEEQRQIIKLQLSIEIRTSFALFTFFRINNVIFRRREKNIYRDESLNFVVSSLSETFEVE